MSKQLLLPAMCCGALLAAHVAAQAPPAAASDTSPDPRLVDFVATTLASHPRVSVAAAQLGGSRSLERAADRPLFNPEIGVELEHAQTNDRAIEVSQTLDIAGQRRARLAVASHERRIAEHELATARQELAVELLAALAEYWAAAELDALAAMRVEVMGRFADVAEQRRRAGDLTQVDLNVANLARSEARLERAEAAAAWAKAEQGLRALAGLEFASSWPRLPELPRAGQLPAAAVDIDELPSVRVYRERFAAAAAAVDLRDRERAASPTLSIVGGEEDDESLIGISFSMPLNLRNRYRHEVSAARAQAEGAERELDNARISARTELAAARTCYELIHAAWEQWRQTGAPNLAEQSELLDRLWQAGELDVSDYLVRIDQTLDTEVSALEIERRLQLAWLDWLAAAGRVGTWLGVPIEAASVIG